MTGKYHFVLGRLVIELKHNPLLENNIVLTLHYPKNKGELRQWKGRPSGFYRHIFPCISVHRCITPTYKNSLCILLTFIPKISNLPSYHFYLVLGHFIFAFGKNHQFSSFVFFQGGIKAVIWTDTFQCFCMLGGLLLITIQVH